MICNSITMKKFLSGSPKASLPTPKRTKRKKNNSNKRKRNYNNKSRRISGGFCQSRKIGEKVPEARRSREARSDAYWRCTLARASRNNEADGAFSPIEKNRRFPAALICNMAGAAGLEPTHAGVKVPCLTDLATPLYPGGLYKGFSAVNRKAFFIWVVGATGLEPAALRSRTARATKLRYAPAFTVIKYTQSKVKCQPKMRIKTGSEENIFFYE